MLCPPLHLFYLSPAVPITFLRHPGLWDAWVEPAHDSVWRYGWARAGRGGQRARTGFGPMAPIRGRRLKALTTSLSRRLLVPRSFGSRWCDLCRIGSSQASAGEEWERLGSAGRQRDELGRLGEIGRVGLRSPNPGKIQNLSCVGLIRAQRW